MYRRAYRTEGDSRGGGGLRSERPQQLQFPPVERDVDSMRRGDEFAGKFLLWRSAVDACEVLYLTHSLEKEQSQTTQLFVVMTVQELRVNDADTLTDI